MISTPVSDDDDDGAGYIPRAASGQMREDSVDGD